LHGTSTRKSNHIIKVGQIRQKDTEYIRLGKKILFTRNGNYKESRGWAQGTN
jgi:hypothetical protein